MIELKQVSKVYRQQGQDFTALQPTNLMIKQGTIFGIIGKSGAGKSTLLRLINLLEVPSTGDVLFNGIALNTLPEPKLRQVRRKIGMIFQHFHLLNSRNVFDNISLPLEIQGVSQHIINTKVSALLRLVELEDKADAYPNQLSGGQKQRVAIARALVTDPEVLLCDEATSSLDPETTASILSLLKKINQNLGITIVLITHEMDVIKQVCHEVAVLEQGKVVEKNDIVGLFTKPKSSLARRLIGTALHIELPSAIQASLQAERAEGLYPVVKLSFLGEKSKTPLLSEITQRYHVACNILLANIGTVAGNTIGVTVCQLVGGLGAVEAALVYLNNYVLVEILGYAS